MFLSSRIQCYSVVSSFCYWDSETLSRHDHGPWQLPILGKVKEGERNKWGKPMENTCFLLPAPAWCHFVYLRIINCQEWQKLKFRKNKRLAQGYSLLPRLGPNLFLVSIVVPFTELVAWGTTEKEQGEFGDLKSLFLLMCSCHQWVQINSEFYSA